MKSKLSVVVRRCTLFRERSYDVVGNFSGEISAIGRRPKRKLDVKKTLPFSHWTKLAGKISTPDSFQRKFERKMPYVIKLRDWASSDSFLRWRMREQYSEKDSRIKYLEHILPTQIKYNVSRKHNVEFIFCIHKHGACIMRQLVKLSRQTQSKN